MKRARINIAVTITFDPTKTNPEELCSIAEQGLAVRLPAHVEIEAVRGGAEVAYFETHQAMRFVVSEAVAAAMQLDSDGHREGYGIDLADVQPKHGAAVTGTPEQMERFAQFLVDMALTHGGGASDCPAATVRACVRAGERLREQVAAERSSKP